MVVLPRNPGLLLTILPLSVLAPHVVIQLANDPISLLTFVFFARVQKIRILKVLYWLKANNPLYTDIVINLDLLNTWKDKFVPVDIASCILEYKSNISEQEGYAVDFESNNFENKLHHIVNTTSLNDSGCLSNCFFIDVNDARKHPTTKLILVLANYKDSRTLINPGSEVPLLIYQNKDYIKPFNDRNNPDFFTTVFLTLFCFGIGGHLIKKD